MLIVDEKIYQTCMKVGIELHVLYSFFLYELLTHHQFNVFGSIFIYPGDFHIIKNMMIVLWDLLNGPGIEDVFENIDKTAASSSILE